MKVDGRCYCGAITFEAEVDPDKMAICHCTDCQTMSGSAFRTVIPAESGSFKLLSGEPAGYVKTAESGNKRLQAFCSTCATPVYATSPGDGPKVYNLRVGTLRQRDQLKPNRQIWLRSRRPWLETLMALPGAEKQ